MRIVEKLSRGIVRAMRSQFKSPREAVRELVDNALDHSLGQRIRVEIEILPDCITVENIGGRGMGLAELAEFVTWGSSSHDSPKDIGMYGQGGKSAISYLGRGFRLWCRRAGSPDVYTLEDDDLLERVEPRDYGELAPLPDALIPQHLKWVPLDKGFVSLEILAPDPELEIDAEEIARDISAVYAPALARRRVRIVVNNCEVRPRDVGLDPDVPRQLISVSATGVTVKGWVGKMGRALNRENPPKPGISLFWRGRRIEEGEWFGANAWGKGSLAAFFGELHVEGWLPNLNKTAFNARGSHEWREVGGEIIGQAKPLLDALREGTDGVRVTARDRSLAQQVRRELDDVLQKLISSTSSYADQAQQLTPGPATSAKGGPHRGATPRQRKASGQPRSERHRVHVPSMPEIVIDAWEGSVRAETREVKGRLVIAVNKMHPAYSAASARFAIAESAICECLRAGGGIPGIDEFVQLSDQALSEWAQLHGGVADV
jgi:hypothetical protein